MGGKLCARLGGNAAFIVDVCRDTVLPRERRARDAAAESGGVQDFQAIIDVAQC
jgi:hypothetical protein